VRVGFVGAGAIAQRHFKVLGRQPGVRVAAVCDVDAARARQVAEQVGAAAHTQWERMLADEQLDAIFVCTPPALHAGPAVAVLETGIPLYLEKPLARSVEDGRAIVEAWRRWETVCAIGYQWRSLVVLAELRRRLAGAAPGMLVSRSMGSTEPARGDVAQASSGGGSWFVDPRASGGILFELGSHDIDLQVAVAGPVESVQGLSGRGLLALAGRRSGDLDDAVAVLLRFRDGGVGAVHVAWTDAARPAVYALDVLSTEAALHLALDSDFCLSGRAGGEDVALREPADPRETSVVRFLAAARDRDPSAVPATPQDALETLRVALAAEQAIASGRPVAL
jgi:predicted dehydrogenase